MYVTEAMTVNINRLQTFRGAIVALFVFVLLGCSPVQKALKSGDLELIYNSGVEYYEAEQWSKAITLFEGAMPYYSGTQREDSLHFFTARAKFKNGEYEEAINLFDSYRKKFGRSPNLEDAEGMYTLSYYYMAPRPTRDQTITQLAINKIDEFTSRYPKSDHLDDFMLMRQELMERLHEKDYQNAYTYYKIGRYKSAISAFKNSLRRYPESARREDISYYILLSNYELASNSVVSKQQERYLATIDSYYTFVSEFPDSDHASKALKVFNESRKFLDQFSADEEVDNK